MLLVGLCGCVSAPRSVSDEEAAGRQEVCRNDAKLVCTYRMGKVHKCYCKSDEDLREILDPDFY